MDYSLPGYSVHGIFQARILECVVPFPAPGDLPDSGMEPMSFVSPALAGRFFIISATWEALWEPWKKLKVKSLSRVQLFATQWTVSYQVPPSMGFSRQEYWSELPFPSPGDLPTQGLNPGLPHCRQPLYHLNHQGNPYWYANVIFCWFWGEVWTALLFLWGFSKVNWVLSWMRGYSLLEWQISTLGLWPIKWVGIPSVGRNRPLLRLSLNGVMEKRWTYLVIHIIGQKLSFPPKPISTSKCSLLRLP